MKLHLFFSVTVFCLRDFDMEMLKVHDCVRSFHMDVCEFVAVCVIGVYIESLSMQMYEIASCYC